MIILSHRGYWKTENEKNSEVAFKRSFALGFGTETDVRDFNGNLVISHDMPKGNEISLRDFLELANYYACKDNKLVLALNIKSDGLSQSISSITEEYENLECFVFDMSIPDMRDYLRRDITVFTRMSEVELQPVWLDQCSGIWLDSFESEWFSNSMLIELLSKKKRICVVSPDLHQRDHKALWQRLKPLVKEPTCMLCTDFPEQARDFFQID